MGSRGSLRNGRMPDSARTSLTILKSLLSPIKILSEKPATIKEWIKALSETCSPFILAGSETQSNHLDRQINDTALETFRTHLESCIQGASYGIAFNPNEVLPLLRDKLMSLDVRDVGDQLKGVQILSIEEARYVPFQTVFILGCAEGLFPKALPKDNLLDNLLKTRLGLPGWEYMEAIEESTFQLLQARLPSLQTSYPIDLSSEPGVRSHYIERELIFGKATEIKWILPKIPLNYWQTEVVRSIRLL